MLSLGPVNDKEKVKNYFEDNNISYNGNSKCVAALSGEEVQGYCLFDMDSKSITVRFITPLEDVALADGILRSTLHVAAERSIMDAYYADTVPESFLVKIGFIKDSENKTLDIDKLFGGCRSCKK